MADLPSHQNKSLILHSGGIGDLLLSLPAMRFFRQAFSQSILELMGHPERLALVCHDLRANSLHSIEQAGMAYFYLEGSSLPSGLSSLFGSFGAAVVFGRTGARILADNLRRAGVGRVVFVPSFPPLGPKIHISEYLVESLRLSGIEGVLRNDPLQVSREAQSSGRKFLAASHLKHGERILAIHPGSGSGQKNWAPRNFAEVADWACGRARVLLISGPAEDGSKELRRAMKSAEPVIAQNLPLVQLAGVLQSCTAYLGNDSGITHLAAVLRIPTTAVFGPTDPAIWGPRGPRVKILPGMKNLEPVSVIKILETWI